MGVNPGDSGWVGTGKGSPPSLTLSAVHMLFLKWALFNPQAAPFYREAGETMRHPVTGRETGVERTHALRLPQVLASPCPGAASKHPRECTHMFLPRLAHNTPRCDHHEHQVLSSLSWMGLQSLSLYRQLFLPSSLQPASVSAELPPPQGFPVS